MRIIKLSPDDPDMRTPEMVKDYFNNKLRERNPQGQFLVTKGRIAEKGMWPGELLIFSYIKGNIVYLAESNSFLFRNEGEESERYPKYFLIDIESIREGKGHLRDLEDALDRHGIPHKNIANTRCWYPINESEDNKDKLKEIWESFKSPIPFKDNQIIEIIIPGQVPSEDDLFQLDLPESTYEERCRIQNHRKVERNPQAAQAAKQFHGYTCQVCAFNYEKVYGKLGHKYIEAHHLKPMYELPPNQAIKVSPKDDFAVLCSNCHRMIHRENPILSLIELREIVQKIKK